MRLKSLPNIDSKKVLSLGSLSVGQILKRNLFKKNIIKLVPSFPKRKFLLINFHPTTKYVEPLNHILLKCVQIVKNLGFSALITFPNYDKGNKKIITTIDKLKNKNFVHVYKSLGFENFSYALKYCSFTIVNTSSLLTEVPYFNKYSLVVGKRQLGRTADENVIWIQPKTEELKRVIEMIINKNKPPKNNFLYIIGRSINKILSKIESKFVKF